MNIGLIRGKKRHVQTFALIPERPAFGTTMLKAFDKWLLPWLRQSIGCSKAPVTDVMLAVCDHFEPFHHTDKDGAMRRMKAWHDSLPAVTDANRDHDGSGPRHTFFYPVEQYDSEVVQSLAALCQKTRNEVEVHLHHENDTAENFARLLTQGKTDLRKHGLLGGNASGEAAFGFIHGNWALDDSDPQGEGCGVKGELAILKQTGCYADFTMPSAPHRTQTPIVNQLYYSRSNLKGCSHHQGTRVSNGESGTRGLRDKDDHLLLVQGPLGLDWQRRKWGLLPRVENSDITSVNPPTAQRMTGWINAGISVAGADGWRFVKLHTHGGPERNHEALIGDARRKFHTDLTALAASAGFRLHYVSAREMVNILHAAEDGNRGNAGEWRDYIYGQPPSLQNA
ncbi:hypothetical protein [Prosthecobacter sp.]|uniref:hypothetical protein n=1 Tax=Prosthecobacter sp. TaxID=1965333 RepID=UPI0024883B0C|nr:hypothetical protein [Prosthecobacter sp.]MDI1310835.1 hypothetical protein [Prosthecobacter sp.]